MSRFFVLPTTVSLPIDVAYLNLQVRHERLLATLLLRGGLQAHDSFQPVLEHTILEELALEGRRCAIVDLVHVRRKSHCDTFFFTESDICVEHQLVAMTPGCRAVKRSTTMHFPISRDRNKRNVFIRA